MCLRSTTAWGRYSSSRPRNKIRDCYIPSFINEPFMMICSAGVSVKVNCQRPLSLVASSLSIGLHMQSRIIANGSQHCHCKATDLAG